MRNRYTPRDKKHMKTKPIKQKSGNNNAQEKVQ